MKLNGWQRLFVLVSVIYVIPVMIVGGSKISSYSSVINKLYEGCVEHDLHKNISSNNTVTNGAPVDVLDLYNDKVDFRCSKKPPPKDEHYKQQAFTLFLIVLSWLVPVVSAYILGSSIGWVYRGFKDS